MPISRELEDVAKTLVAIGGAGGLVWRYAARPTLRAVRARVLEPLALIRAVHGEVFPNGGSSLRDVVNGTALAVAGLGERQGVQMAILRTVANELDVGMFECTADGQCVRVNQSWSEWTGLGQAEAAGWGWLRGVAPDARDAVREAWQDAVADRRPFLGRVRYQHIEVASVTTADVEAFPVLNGTGAITGWVGTARELKARKPSLEELDPNRRHHS